MNLSANEQEAIEMIEDSYGGRLTSSAKAYLKKHHLDDYISTRTTTEEVCADLKAIFPPRPTSQEHRTETIENGISVAEKNHAFSLSAILALEARRKPKVVAFRTDHLQGKLLTKDKIEPWITRVGKREGTPTGSRELVFWSEDSRVVTSRYVVDGGVLDQLRILSKRLARGHGWELEQTSTFVLSDAIPIFESINVGTKYYPDHPYSSRITLEIDPSMPSADVVNAYTWARNEYLERPSRLQSIRNQNLALFYAQHVVYAESKEKRRVRLEKWNDMCATDAIWEEGWKYEPTPFGLSNFQRDSRTAYEELVRDKFKKEVISS